jgi:hypothetical protein
MGVWIRYAADATASGYGLGHHWHRRFQFHLARRVRYDPARAKDDAASVAIYRAQSPDRGHQSHTVYDH